MKLLPRRSTAPAEPSEAEEVGSSPVGKGRPTPKRRDAAGTRGPVSAPKTRKEAYARQKEQTKAARDARRVPAEKMTPAQRRAALRSGDASLLPRRDQGTSRKLARDYVDSHRMASNYLLLLFPLLLVSWLLPVLQIIVIAVFAGLLVEWWFVGRKVRQLSIERYGEAQGGPMTLGFYAGSRAYLPRRWRLPRPTVQRGDSI